MIIIAVGILVGIICSLPVGQIGVLSINRTLKYGFTAGFTVGVTSALLDSISCLGIMYGVSAFSQISSAKFVLYGINIVLLVYLGVTNILKKESRTEKYLSNNNNQNILKTILLVVAMYYSNVSLFLVWATIANIIHSYSFVPPRDGNYLFLAAGVAIGALSLYFLMLKSLHYKRHQLRPELANHLTKATGYLFLVFALGLFITLIKNF